MKSSDKTIVVGVGVLVLTVLFYFMVLSPKRERAAELSDEISSLESSIDEQEQLAAYGEEARKQYPTYYGRLVVLGKAVPEGGDTASMLVQLNGISDRDDVNWLSITLDQNASGAGSSSASTTSAQPAAAAAASTATPPAGTEGAAPADGSTTTGTAEGESASAGAAASAGSSAVPTPAAATETIAASLPLGAVVGPAGLPTLPYNLEFQGGYFDFADYFGGLDELVKMREGSGQVSVDGRLITVDGFALKGGRPGSDPTLTGTVSVTTYTTPSTQGLLAGASPGGPAPTPTPAAPTTPASSVTP
jgi:Tfp pilus assembly protein PilO